MKYTKRSRRRNIQRILAWYVREGKVNELDIMVGMPELYEVMESEEELDFDDVVRAFDFVGVDLVAVPRAESRKMEWYTVNEVPYDDGGKNRDVTALELMYRRKGRHAGRSTKGRRKERQV